MREVEITLYLRELMDRVIDPRARGARLAPPDHFVGIATAKRRELRVLVVVPSERRRALRARPLS